MANKYGYFRYDDIVVGAKEQATFSTNTELQPGSTVESLKEGVTPYDFASLETDTYITAMPKRLADDEPLGFVPTIVSDENGNLSSETSCPVIMINFGEDAKRFTTYGITIHAANILRHVRMQLLTPSGILTYDFYASDKDEFFAWEAAVTSGIMIQFREIDRPGAFLRVYNIELGRTVVFDDVNTVSAQVHTTFTLTGESIEYDTLDLHVLYDQAIGFFFQRRQPLVFFGPDGQVKQTFYVDQGETVETSSGLQRAYTAKISAYDIVASMEDTFLGGMHDNTPVSTLLADIMGDVPYTLQGADDVTMTGYIPITTRRQALALVCRVCNLRPYRGASMTIKPIETSVVSTYAQNNIVDAPTIDAQQEQVSVTLKAHNYSKGTEEKELYHWYISKTSPVTITWSDPVHAVKAYEVTGVDENGNDIVSETETSAVTFTARNANYCTVVNTSDNKIVLRGLLYVDSTVEHTKSEEQSQAYDTVNTVTIEDQTILSDAEDVLDVLYDAYTRSATVSCKIIDAPDSTGQRQGVPYAGQKAWVIDEFRTVASITDNLNGVYEVEAT